MAIFIHRSFIIIILTNLKKSNIFITRYKFKFKQFINCSVKNTNVSIINNNDV